MAYIETLTLRNFRCFTDKTFSFEKGIVLIEGENGVGKTALLEAIHYLCYLKSFRTSAPRDLIRFEQEGFFIQAKILSDEEVDEIHVGSTGKKRNVKINGKQIATFNEFNHNLKVVSLAEGDMQLIQGAPEFRRSFIDQYIFLHTPSIAEELHRYKNTLEQRNALFQCSFDKTAYDIWTKNLWKLALSIQKQRTHFLAQLTKTINALQATKDFSITIDTRYQAKRRLYSSIEEFFDKNTTLKEDEQRYQRTLFGAHLDDFIITFKDKNSRFYASRGQQKLILFLTKVAQIQDLLIAGRKTIFLLDDFMTDFDEKKVDILLPLLASLGISVFFTSAQQKGLLYQKLQNFNIQYMRL